ncbi:host nuclease inhibitor GamL [Enterobacter bugandensis]|uniref:host nuclease inhibitor GamL n=1 Tax=Enterobacter bugandensis TaxID=881260 RepID=UPI003F427C0E
MNAYYAQDRIEAQRDFAHQAAIQREQWIDNRAKELIAMFPKNPLHMSSLFLPEEAQLALVGDKAEEAYNDYISNLCYLRAEEEWERQAPCPF